MSEITIPEGVGLAGVIAILLRNHWPAIKMLAVSFLGKVAPSIAADPTADDVAHVMAYTTLIDRLSESTAATVWAEIQPQSGAEEEIDPPALKAQRRAKR
jgi:hypothetical protein